jgi:hypothetical protein
MYDAKYKFLFEKWATLGFTQRVMTISFRGLRDLSVQFTRVKNRKVSAGHDSSCRNGHR